MDEKPKSGYDRYDELRHNEKERNFNVMVPKAIGIMGVICLIGGTLSIFNEQCSFVESVGIIAGSFLLFGFSIVVKAACKYLDK